MWHEALRRQSLKKEVSMEEALWKSADKLRGSVEPSEYKHVVLSLFSLFYTTDISVTLWILNKNKKARVVEQNGKFRRYRNRENEILFMDLRQMGSPYEKKYIELTEADREKVTAVYHNWQQEGYSD